MSSSLIDGVTRYLEGEQRIQDILYVEAPKEYTATMYCAKCDDRTKVLQTCLLFAWEPECENCGTTVPLSYAKVIVSGPEEQIRKHAEEIKGRAE